MRKVIWALALGVGLLLGGCGSSVRLNNDVPVIDRSSSAGGVDNEAAPAPVSSGNAVSSGTVQSVDLAGKAGPSGAVAAADLGRVVYFDYDSFAIRPEFQSLLNAQARLLKADPGRRVTIEGHTDERGGREYNLALGQRRADAVRRALLLLGVADAQVESISYGKEKPAVAGSSDAAMEKNRRAEISNR